MSAAISVETVQMLQDIQESRSGNRPHWAEILYYLGFDMTRKVEKVSHYFRHDFSKRRLLHGKVFQGFIREGHKNETFFNSTEVVTGNISTQGSICYSELGKHYEDNTPLKK